MNSKAHSSLKTMTTFQQKGRVNFPTFLLSVESHFSMHKLVFTQYYFGQSGTVGSAVVLHTFPMSE